MRSVGHNPSGRETCTSPCNRISARGKSGAGFTLLEIMMVMAFVAIIGGFTLAVSMDSFRGYMFHSDRDLLVTALQRARSQAIGNVCLGALCSNGKPHGVAIRPADNPNAYVIFQTETATPTYAARTADDKVQDIAIETNAGTTFTPASAEFVFTNLSGNVIAPGTITVAASGHSSTITVGTEGQIQWTN